MKQMVLLQHDSSPLKKVQWLAPSSGIENVYMPTQFFGKQFATVFIVKADKSSKAEQVYVVNP